MPETYLNTSYKDREEVKLLGARWDADQRKWYVPGGRDLAAFARWLPAHAAVVRLDAGSDVAIADPRAGTVRAIDGKGVALSQLLAGVAQLVAQAYKAGIWTTAEVLKVDVRRGHVYLELAERDTRGDSVAQARAMIWADTANRIVPAFEQATGAVLGGGIKLLVRAKPAMHALYGLSLVIDAIDPDYTLGDLEAHKREIRLRLQREGLFDANRKLPPPWDFNAVLVVAPQGAAGLGDFQAEAQRLQRLGLCEFVYVHSRFQGEGAAAEVLASVSAALAAWRGAARPLPDAVVIIRGGGAVNDLAWLNDYDLARFVCGLDVPVLTGIGHERDSTVLDEVANQRFDTPSKVIAGIEQVIVRRTTEAKAAFQRVAGQALQVAQFANRRIDQAEASVKMLARQQIVKAREGTASMMSTVRVGALQSVRNASASTTGQFLAVRHRALDQLGLTKQAVPSLLAEIRTEARQSLRLARGESAGHLRDVLAGASVEAREATLEADRGLRELAMNARRVVADACDRSQALMREIAGQGPEKSLGRGFAIVRFEGAPVTSAFQAPAGADIEIQFRDGSLAARAAGTQGKEPK